MSESPAPFNAGNEKQVGRRKSKRERESERIKNAQRYVMSDERGRQFVWWAVSEAGMFRNAKGATNADTNCNIGMANQGRKLWDVLEKQFPDEMVLMYLEAVKIKNEERKIDQGVDVEAQTERELEQ